MRLLLLGPMQDTVMCDAAASPAADVSAAVASAAADLIWYLLLQRSPLLPAGLHPHLQAVAKLQQHLEAVHRVAALGSCCEADDLWLAILVVVLFPNLQQANVANTNRNSMRLTLAVTV